MRPISLIALSTCLSFVSMQVARAAPAPDKTATPAHDDDAEALALAKKHYEAGNAAFGKGNFDVAVREFQAAQALKPSPILSYNIALAYDRGNKGALAVQHYQTYLAQNPNAANRIEVMERLRVLAPQSQVAPPAPPPMPTEPPTYAQHYVPQPPPGSLYPPGYVPPPPAYAPHYGYVLPPPVVVHHNYWWVWLAVIGGVGLLATIIAVAVSEDNNNHYYYRDLTVKGPAALPLARVPSLTFHF